jgi:SNF2 family DNA or RNA helicase
VNQQEIKNLPDSELEEFLSDKDLAIKNPPYHHQKVSLAFTAINNLKRVLFIHGIGTGKTLTALALRNMKQATRTLVACPNSVIKTWKEEIKLHTYLNFCVLKGSAKERIKVLLNTNFDIYIINYEGLKLIGAERNKGKYKLPKNEIISRYNINCFIADECQSLKNSDTIQTKVAVKISESSEYCTFLTGTPIARTVLDMFSIMYTLDLGDTFGDNFYKFRHFFFYQKYKGGFFRGGNDWNPWLPKRLCQVCRRLMDDKVKHLHDKHQMSAQRYLQLFKKPDRSAEDIILDRASTSSLRYDLSECTDLPEKIYEKRIVSMTKEQIEMTGKVIVGLPINKITGQTVQHHTQKLVQITSGFLLKDGEVIHEMSSNPKLDILKSILLEEIDGKVIIYHQYTHESKMITRLLKKLDIKYTVIKQGSDSERAIDDFRKPETSVLVANPKSGGVGLNLQVANITIFFSNGYIGNILRQQSEGRTHRSGQSRSCIFIDIVMEDSIDEVLYRSLMNNEQYIKQVLEYLTKKV